MYFYIISILNLQQGHPCSCGVILMFSKLLTTAICQQKATSLFYIRKST
jgi:hypothetical protein